jgi:hypothetical protein
MPRKGTLTILIRWNRTTIRCLVTLRRYKTTAAVAYFLTNRTVRKPLCYRGYKVLKKEYFTVKFSRFFTPLYPAKLKRNPRSSCKRYLRVVKSSSIGTCLEFESDFLTTAEYIDFVGGAAVLATATGDASLDFCDCDVTISWISLALRCDVNWLLAWNVGQIHAGKEPNLSASAYNIPSV